MLGQMRKLKQEAHALRNNPTESTFLRPWVLSLAEIEKALREETRALEEAADVERGDAPADPEDRADELLELVGSMFSQNTVRHYLETHTDVAEAAEVVEFAEMNGDEWREQKARWADGYRAKAPDETEGMTDDELAEIAVSERFGVSLDTFESEIVEFSREDAIREVIAGPLEETEESIRDVRERLADEEEGSA